MKKLRVLPSTGLCFALPVVLFAAYWSERPFSQVISTQTISLRDLSPQQKLNVQNAAARLHGAIVKPQEGFSFNERVGPRTVRRGYLPAPSYVGVGAPNTVGGGICLLSSALYEDALTAGLKVTKRTPHMRTIHSVPPGLDATVWYGIYDLALFNTFSSPIKIATTYSPDDITITITGSYPSRDWKPATISRREIHPSPTVVSVIVTTTQFGKTQVVSNDNYTTTQVGARTR